MRADTQKDTYTRRYIHGGDVNIAVSAL